MNLPLEVRKRLGEIFRRAYQEKENREAGEVDRRAIMDQIRKRGRLPRQTPSFASDFERFVWKLAPAIGLSILLLIFLTSIFPAFDFLNENGRYGFLDGEGEELRLEQLFGA